MAACLVAGFAGCGDKDKPKTEEPVASEDETDNDYSDDDQDDVGEAGEDESKNASDEYPNPEEDYEADNIGMTVHLPVEYTNTIGSVVLSDMDLTGYREVYYAEMDYIGVLMDAYDDEISEEEASEYGNNTVPLFGVYAITGDRSADELARIISDDTGSAIDGSDLTPLATEDGFDYYEYTSIDKSNRDNLNDEYKAEYDKLSALKDDVLKNAKYYRPSDALDPYDENGLDFTTTDFDGNTITSRELFSKHEFTMINVWATWCGCCCQELPALCELNHDLAAKDCAIVGLCGDVVDDDSLEFANMLLNQNDYEAYLNIRPFDGWEKKFVNKGDWPTSFFVNRKGDIVSDPISGAAVEEYKQRFDELLAGEEATRVKRSNTYSNSENCYRIRVVSNDLQPIEGATVQFCSDDNCKMGATGSDGIATFDNPPGVYEVHVLKVPDGYKEDTSLYRTDDQHSDMVIILERS